MKTDNNKVRTQHAASLQQLLADVEHAGRDERRRQELGDMIDRLEGERLKVKGERYAGAKHTSRHLSLTFHLSPLTYIAAAACVLFFIGTAVRVWFIPTGESATVVAEAEVPVTVPAAVDSTTVVTTIAAPVRQRPHARPQVIAETPVVVEEYVAEEVPAELMEVEEPVVERQDKVMMIEEAAVSEPAPIAQTESVETIAAPIVSVSNTSEQPVATAEERKSKRASIFKNIFRRHEPSKMDGTMLALNIL